MTPKTFKEVKNSIKEENFMQTHPCSEDQDSKFNLLYAFWYEQMCIEVVSQRKSLKGSGIFYTKHSFGVEWCFFAFSFCS